MKTLAVVLEQPERLSLAHLDLTPAAAGDLVVDIAYSGISTGTEKLLWTGRMPSFPGMGYPLVPGYESNFQQGRVSRHIYFSALVETAAWGAELASALAGSAERGHIYVVEPQGPFEDDPNVTDKRFPGNPTQSYRTPAPLRVVAELADWQGHAPDVLKAMLDHLTQLREQGLDVIED